MMRIKNPIDEDLKLNFKGKDYVLQAGVSDEFPADVAAQWILIYGFVEVTKAKDKEVDEVVEEIEKAKKPAKKTAKKKEDKK